jgi:PAS domain S-box-containing protein
MHSACHRGQQGLKVSDLPVDPKMILGHVQDGLLFVDLNGKILWTNEIFKKMLGREDEDLTGMSCCELGVSPFCAENCPVKTDGADRCAGVEAHFNVDVQAPAGKGEPGAYCFMTSPVCNDEGRIIGYMENFRGMHRVKDVLLQFKEVNDAISAERNKAEDLINSMADGVFSVDEQLNISRFSSNMERIMGISAEQALGRPCREVLQGTLCDTDCPLRWSLKHGKPVTGCREDLLAADGRTVPVSISTGFLGNKPDIEQGLFGVLTDRSEVEALRSEIEGRQAFHNMIGRSVPMRSLYQQIEAVAPTGATVLVGGETGTGKELVARAIHRESPRSKGPFVGVNCAALVDDLLASELFGHVKGAFTGALNDRQGRFEQARGGTLFLDEVGDTSPALQVKLLRAVQEKVIERVGSGKVVDVDVRIIAASNKNLEEEVHNGRFREDLFYRLNVFPIHVRPLRERTGDIPLLLQYFMDKHARTHLKGNRPEFQGISERALALMLEYSWPGNVRELDHAVEYAMISSETGRIERAFLPQALRNQITTVQPGRLDTPPTPAMIDAGVSTPETEQRKVLMKALDLHHWNVTATAAELGISRTTLWRRMKLFEIDRV